MIKILNYTKNPLNHIGEIAGLCWNSNTSSQEKNIKRAKECIKNNHGRTLEYADCEILIDKYSARVMREWYTHIGGSPTRLQESTRYVQMNDFSYFTPPLIEQNSTALALYRNCMDNIQNTYNQLLQLGISKEDTANILPLAYNTKVITKMNLRMLTNMFENRLCTRAYHEYRNLMINLKKELSQLDDEWKWISDNLFVSKCEKLKYCPEKYGCGKYPNK